MTVGGRSDFCGENFHHPILCGEGAAVVSNAAVLGLLLARCE